MRIPDDKIDEIRGAADIVEVVSGFVRLRKSGRGFMGLCPFHTEKTPSFHVHPEKGLYKCFGCGKGGNVITFIMEMERVGFVEAVTTLADRYNITLPTAKPEDKDTAEKRDALHKANTFAARFFYDSLQAETGEQCRAYLKRRGWTQSTQKHFGLGYAPGGWDALMNAAQKAGISKDVLQEAGLIIKKDSGKTYDRFRDRLMFPILSVGRKVVGFGARALNPEDEPKYLNSPETAVYNKSRLLYGLSFAVPSIRERDAVVLVEGYADVIALSQAGIGNAVATSGTALTPHQIRLLMRYTQNVLFLYDADSAGANAMLRSIDLFLDEGIIPGIVLLSQGEDPDSYVKKEGADALNKLLAKPQSFVDFITARYKEDGKLDSPEGKADAVRHIVSLLVKIDDKLKRDFYLHHISERYGIYESLLYNELQAQTRGQQPRIRRNVDDQDGQPYEDDDGEQKAIIPVPKYEAKFMTTLLNTTKDVISETLSSIQIGEFQHKGVQHILLALFEQKEDHGQINVESLGGHFNDDTHLQALLADFVLGKLVESENWKEKQTVLDTDDRQILLDYYRFIILDRVKERLRLVEQRLSRVKGDADMEKELIQQTLHWQDVRMKAQIAHQFSELPPLEE